MNFSTDASDFTNLKNGVDNHLESDLETQNSMISKHEKQTAAIDRLLNQNKVEISILNKKIDIIFDFMQYINTNLNQKK